ncbi:MAG: GDP-mannose 4,6-dehydratase [Vallitaleaceae bacterium]|nr:GDP-mannose 4,6-dehydratase [Vallitaleaceae bacterium]
MKCVVTGACGFIGINLCKKLLDDGHYVTGIDNFIVGTIDELKRTCGEYKNFNFKQFDLSKRYSDESLFEDIEVIYHLGGMSGVRESILTPDIWFDNNVKATFNTLEIARKYTIKNIVIASSSACAGDVPPPMHEEMPMHPISPYGASKGCKELFTSAYYHSYGMNVSALRFSNVYGPHSTIKVSLVAKFIRKILQSEQINIYGNGEQTRDFIYVDDLTDAVIKASKKKVGGEIFQICTGVETSVNKITSVILNKMKDIGYSIPTVKNLPPAKGDVMTNYADNSKAKKILKWEPKVNIEQGINETIQWFVREAIL